MGGSFGRRSSKTADFTVEAVEAAMGESVPVKIIWSREEDIRSGHYRPLFVHKMRGSLDASGMPDAWHQVAVGQSLMQGSKHDPCLYGTGNRYLLPRWLSSGAVWCVPLWDLLPNPASSRGEP